MKSFLFLFSILSQKKKKKGHILDSGHGFLYPTETCIVFTSLLWLTPYSEGISSTWQVGVIPSFTGGALGFHFISFFRPKQNAMKAYIFRSFSIIKLIDKLS